VSAAERTGPDEFHAGQNPNNSNKEKNMYRYQVFSTILETGMIPIFYHHEVDTATHIAAACAEGGARTLELTNRGDQALKVFSELYAFISKEGLPLTLGIGSIVDAPTAALFIAHGAEFVVSPVFNPDVARLCNRRKIAYIPGCGSASEVSESEEHGAEIVKVFPADSLGGPSFIRSILAPMPWSRLMPTRGVDATAESIQAWIAAGAACVGMGSALIRKDLVKAGDFNTIQENVIRTLQWIKDARGQSN
jgi:2-dehydro-3-deoxyphosphogluconate aldolase/(4S)-4-hydroxy-2-oxoglutarate aldolase